MNAKFLGIFLVAGLAVGCGNQWEDLCQEEMDCEGGNDEDVQACIDSYQAGEEIAADYDCSDEFDSFYECYIDNASCDSTLDSYGVDATDCDNEATDYLECISDASSLDN